MLDKRLKAYYRQAMYKNKHFVARLIDFLAIRLGVFAVAYVFFSLQMRSTTAGIVLALVITLFLSIVLALRRSIKLDAFVKAKREELCKDYLFEQLVVAPKKEFLSVVQSCAKHVGYQPIKRHPFGFLSDSGDGFALICAAQLHPSTPVSAQLLLDFYREAATLGINEIIIVSTAPFSDEARAFARKLKQCSFKLISRDMLLDLAKRAGLLPDIKVVEAALLEELEHQRVTLKKLKGEALSALRAKSYLTSGLVLWIASTFMGRSLLYPIMGSICMLLAAISFFRGRYRSA